MPTEQVRVLRVVIASPGDVKAEREIIPGIAEELNRTTAHDRGLRLDVSCWETDSFPGFHPDGPQGLIDSLLKIQECDILIAIFWKRFGTPVKDAKSGTEHEFRIAYEAWKKNGTPQIMLYFSQKKYAPKSKAETDQAGLVLQFKEAFPDEGLWWDYKNSADFERLVRNHLINFLSKQFPSRPSPISQPAPVALTPLHQLPPPPADFTGRATELTELRTAIEKGGVHISGLQGQGGVGKTALALKLAAELAPSYPDAQIYLDLKGVSEKPLTAAEAMSHVLRTFHPEAKLPEKEEELRALYLSVLHNKRVLLLMDNAKDASQLEPLTPPEGCTLLVTSRNHFYLPGITWETLYTLPPPDAQRLLLRIAPRAGGEARAIAELCGYLPLALRLAAKVIAERPDLSVIAYRERLANEGAPFVRSSGEIEVAGPLRLEQELLDPRARALATLPLRGQSEGPRALLQVFLCHSRADKPAVRALYLQLQRDGFAPWLDEEQLIGGQDWEYEIKRAVRRSDIVLVCLSRSATGKAGFVQKEIKYALDVADEQPQGVIYIIPLKLEECDVPERLTRWQWINYFGDGGHRNLERALDARAAGVPQGERAGRAAELPEIRDAIQQRGALVYSKASLVPNLVLKNIHTGGLIFTGDEWRQFELPGKAPLSNRQQAVWAELKNDSSELRGVGPITGVKAELVLVRESGDEKFSPLVWLDNEFNAVDFELADTRHVLLVANMNNLLSPTSDWVVPLNHRARSGSSGSSLRMDVSHWMEKENADIRLNLLHIATGGVLQSLVGKYTWREGRSGPSITLKPL